MSKMSRYEILVELAARCRDAHGPGTVFEALVEACAGDALKDAMRPGPGESSDREHDKE